MKRISKILSFFLAITVAFLPFVKFKSIAITVKQPPFEVQAKSAILMDADSGAVLYEYNADNRLPPASVTKVMTLLLVFEAIDSGILKYDDILTVSENAASMGGSQIFLEPGENMSVDELLKSVIVASANDAALTLAEHVGGSEEAFVERMNQRAKELGMVNTVFENVTGLDDDTSDHLTTARDIALMSRELLKHEKVSQYATIWMDTVRNGEFGLSNTNRLVRFYRGITGLKTGSTSKAGFCISASAKRNGLHLIAVIMGAETSEIRNANASKLLDYGFANYSIYQDKERGYDDIPVLGGVEDFAKIKSDEIKILINKGDETKITCEIQLPNSISAPIKEKDNIGKIIYKLNGEIIAENDIYCISNIEKIKFGTYLFRVFQKFLLK